MIIWMFRCLFFVVNTTKASNDKIPFEILCVAFNQKGRGRERIKIKDMTRELDENWKRRERTSEEDALERVCVYVEKEHWLCLRFYCLCSNILLLFYCCISARKTNKHAVVGVGVGFWLCCWSMLFWNGWASYEQQYKEGAAACSSSSASNNSSSSTASRSGIRFLLLLFFLFI